MSVRQVASYLFPSFSRMFQSPAPIAESLVEKRVVNPLAPGSDSRNKCEWIQKQYAAEIQAYPNTQFCLDTMTIATNRPQIARSFGIHLKSVPNTTGSHSTEYNTADSAVAAPEYTQPQQPASLPNPTSIPTEHTYNNDFLAKIALQKIVLSAPVSAFLGQSFATPNVTSHIEGCYLQFFPNRLHEKAYNILGASPPAPLVLRTLIQLRAPPQPFTVILFGHVQPCKVPIGIPQLILLSGTLLGTWLTLCALIFGIGKRKHNWPRLFKLCTASFLIYSSGYVARALEMYYDSL